MSDYGKGIKRVILKQRNTGIEGMGHPVQILSNNWQLRQEVDSLSTEASFVFVRRLSPFLSLHFAEFALSPASSIEVRRNLSTLVIVVLPFVPMEIERNPISESDSEMSTS